MYYEGSHINSIKHAQLRMKYIKLNADLFSLHVVDSTEHICGNDVEDSAHFKFECPLSYVQKQEMMRKLNNMNIKYMEIETAIWM